jgi:membrane-bound lytic murein transglycosylase MltF
MKVLGRAPPERRQAVRAMIRPPFPSLVAAFALLGALPGSASGAPDPTVAPPEGPVRIGDGSSVVYGAVAPFRGDLPAIRARGELRVLVPYSHTEFYVSRGSPRGYVYEQMTLLQKALDQKRARGTPPLAILFVPTPVERLIPDLLAGRGDVAAGLVTVTPERRKVVSFTRPLLRDVDEIVVRNEDAGPVASVEDLSGRTIHVLAGTAQAEHLRAVDARLVSSGRPGVQIAELPAPASREDLLRMVDAGTAGYAVADDFVAGLWKGLLPGLRLEPTARVATGGEIAWAVRPTNPKLLAALDSFVSRKGQDARLTAAVLFQRYYQSETRLRGSLQKDALARLGEHAPHFQAAGERFGFDWLLLGAQAFQESRLDMSARNPSGAVGLMQILPSTAAQMGFPDVHSPRSNVLAGAAYLRHLREEYFDDPGIAPADRIYFALAAYNAGPGNIGDLRRRARRTGLDPDRWFGNVEILAQHHLGEETVHYVSNIHRYYVAYRLSPPPAGSP